MEVKQEIIRLAQSFSGQGDPDFSKQEAFSPLIERLLRAAPQPPVGERLPLLCGVWKQLWGPYTYRGSSRGVDPTLGIDEIYQVVFPDGYYYNVSPLYSGSNRTQVRIDLLRGEYRTDPGLLDVLRVRFTNYPGIKGRPADDSPIYNLAALAEKKLLKNKISIVPAWVVRIFFGGGALKEVFTDQDLRILYGSGSADFTKSYLYIMTRVQEGSTPV
jgi:hypothetical protein